MQFSSDLEALLTKRLSVSLSSTGVTRPAPWARMQRGLSLAQSCLEILNTLGNLQLGKGEEGSGTGRTDSGFPCSVQWPQPTHRELWSQDTLHEVGQEGQAMYPHVGPWLWTDPERGHDLGCSSSLQLGSLWKEDDR